MRDKIFIYLPAFQHNILVIWMRKDKALSIETPSSFTTGCEFMTVPPIFRLQPASCLPNRMSWNLFSCIQFWRRHNDHMHLDVINNSDLMMRGDNEMLTVFNVLKTRANAHWYFCVCHFRIIYMYLICLFVGLLLMATCRGCCTFGYKVAHHYSQFFMTSVHLPK